MITTDKDIERYVQAMDFACDAHASQLYGTRPYVRHLAHVEGVLLRFSFSDYDLLTASWLHDAIEDAGVAQSEIATRFGEDVALLVFAVTDGEGVNRRERKAASYAKMIEYPRAIILKLADRVANTESSLVSGDQLIGMYKKEYPAFREKLYAASLSEANTDCCTRVAALWSYLGDITIQPSASASALSRSIKLRGFGFMNPKNEVDSEYSWNFSRPSRRRRSWWLLCLFLIVIGIVRR